MSFRFNPKGELVVVSTKLFGPHGDFVVKLALDTGATVTLVNKEVLAMVGYNPLQVKDKIEVTTGSGIELLPLVTVKKVEALGKQRRQFPVLCHSLPPSASVDGLIGLDFLRQRSLVLDFRKGLASLK